MEDRKSRSGTEKQKEKTRERERISFNMEQYSWNARFILKSRSSITPIFKPLHHQFPLSLSLSLYHLKPFHKRWVQSSHNLLLCPLGFSTFCPSIKPSIEDGKSLRSLWDRKTGRMGCCSRRMEIVYRFSIQCRFNFVPRSAPHPLSLFQWPLEGCQQGIITFTLGCRRPTISH